MSDAAADTTERKQDTLWVTDAEIIRRLGAPRVIETDIEIPAHVVEIVESDQSLRQSSENR